MRIYFVLLFVVAITVAPSVCISGEGNRLYVACDPAKARMEPGLDAEQYITGSFDYGYCRGFSMGLMAMAKIYQVGLQDNHPSVAPIICVPDNTPVSQVQLSIFRYLQNHPNNLHKNEGVLGVLALKEAFPCGK